MGGRFNYTKLPEPDFYSCSTPAGEVSPAFCLALFLFYITCLNNRTRRIPAKDRLPGQKVILSRCPIKNMGGV